MVERVTPGLRPHGRQEQKVRLLTPQQVRDFRVDVSARHLYPARPQQQPVILRIPDDDEFQWQVSGRGVSRTLEENAVTLVPTDGADERDPQAARAGWRRPCIRCRRESRIR